MIIERRGKPETGVILMIFQRSGAFASVDEVQHFTSPWGSFWAFFGGSLVHLEEEEERRSAHPSIMHLHCIACSWIGQDWTGTWNWRVAAGGEDCRGSLASQPAS